MYVNFDFFFPLRYTDPPCRRMGVMLSLRVLKMALWSWNWLAPAQAVPAPQLPWKMVFRICFSSTYLKWMRWNRWDVWTLYSRNVGTPYLEHECFLSWGSRKKCLLRNFRAVKQIITNTTSVRLMWSMYCLEYLWYISVWLNLCLPKFALSINGIFCEYWQR